MRLPLARAIQRMILQPQCGSHVHTASFRAVLRQMRARRPESCNIWHAARATPCFLRPAKWFCHCTYRRQVMVFGPALTQYHLRARGSTGLRQSASNWLVRTRMPRCCVHRTVYAPGRTCSSNFPLEAPIQGWDGTGGCQFFLTTLTRSLSSIAYYSTYLGTATPDYAIEQHSSVAVDGLLNAYIGGNAIAGSMHPTADCLCDGQFRWRPKSLRL